MTVSAQAAAGPIRTIRAFNAGDSLPARLRALARNAVIAALAPTRSPARIDGWIRFPFYHHVFDDERADFARQLRYYKNVADIVSIDDAIAMFNEGGPRKGRYVCITFDDGFKNWIENAVPALLDADATAAFFVAAGYIGTSVDADRDRLLRFYEDGTRLMEFLTWDDCRRMIEAGMTIGSHSVDHVHLLDLGDADAADELQRSKKMIEAGTGAPCRHFCCPFGRAGIDFDPARHPKMAMDAGYASFLTAIRGNNLAGRSPYDVRRDHVLANWGDHQLRYFLGAPG